MKTRMEEKATTRIEMPENFVPLQIFRGYVDQAAMDIERPSRKKRGILPLALILQFRNCLLLWVRCQSGMAII